MDSASGSEPESGRVVQRPDAGRSGRVVPPSTNALPATLPGPAGALLGGTAPTDVTAGPARLTSHKKYVCPNFLVPADLAWERHSGRCRASTGLTCVWAVCCWHVTLPAFSSLMDTRVENFLKNSVAAQPGIQMLILYAVLPTDADPTIRVRQPQIVVEGTTFQAMARVDGPVLTEALSLFRQEQANRRSGRVTSSSTVAAAASLHAFTSGVPVVAAAAAALPPSQTVPGPENGRPRGQQKPLRPEQVRRQELSAAVSAYLRVKST